MVTIASWEGGHLQVRHQVVPQNPIIYQETAVRAAPPEPQATGGGEAAARWMVRDVFFQEKLDGLMVGMMVHVGAVI